jgi:small nuclear ribonucleoprotein D2
VPVSLLISLIIGWEKASVILNLMIGSVTGKCCGTCVAFRRPACVPLFIKASISAPMFLPTNQNNPNEKEKAESMGPLSLLHRSMVKGSPVLVSLRNNKKMKGTVVAYDRHYNILMADAKEISVRVSKNRGKKKKEGKEVARSLGNVFLRGDGVVLVANATVE